MQSCAFENNLSETAFLQPVEGAAVPTWDIRFFTPTVEVDLCGHVSIIQACGCLIQPSSFNMRSCCDGHSILCRHHYAYSVAASRRPNDGAAQEKSRKFPTVLSENVPNR